MTHEPQPSPLWSRSGCLRRHTNGVLPREEILALQRREDVNDYPVLFLSRDKYGFTK